MFHRLVSVWCEFFNEMVKNKHTRFFESVHAASDFDVDVSIGGDINILIVPDLLGGLDRVETHVLVV